MLDFLNLKDIQIQLNINMKYIKLFEKFNDEKNIISSLKEYDIENYTINSDGTIDVDGDVRLNEYGFDVLPFKFGRVSGEFDCSYNKLTTLEGCPYYVGGDFTVNSNQRLINLIGSPVEVGGDVECFNCNKLVSLEGMPLEIGGYFNCRYTSIEDLDSVSNIEGEIICDDDVDISKFSGYCEKITKVERI